MARQRALEIATATPGDMSIRSLVEALLIEGFKGRESRVGIANLLERDELRQGWDSKLRPTTPK